MFIHQLQTIIYPPDGSDWFTEIKKNPTWSDIEVAIRKLDRSQFPFIHLFKNSDAAEDDLPEFSVMGGQGVFTFGTADMFFFDETHSAKEVPVWISDQGASFPEWHVCSNLEIVLSTTKTFSEYGKLDKSVTWRTFT